MPKTVILGSARTPIGKMGGGLASLKATELGGIPTKPDLESLLTKLRGDTLNAFSRAAAAGIDVDALVEVGTPATCIVETATRAHASLVVMGTHGASGFEHLVLGSVTEKVVRKAPCPVLTVPPRAQATSKPARSKAPARAPQGPKPIFSPPTKCSPARKTAPKT